MTAVWAVFGELLADPANLRRIAELLAGSDVHYIRGGRPLVGRWVRDFPLTVDGRVSRLAELARDGRPLLLDLTGRDELAGVAAGWADRVRLVVGTSDTAPAEAILIRPDGYAAWAGGRVAGRVVAGVVRGAGHPIGWRHCLRARRTVHCGHRVRRFTTAKGSGVPAYNVTVTRSGAVASIVDGRVPGKRLGCRV